MEKINSKFESIQQSYQNARAEGGRELRNAKKGLETKSRDSIATASTSAGADTENSSLKEIVEILGPNLALQLVRRLRPRAG